MRDHGICPRASRSFGGLHIALVPLVVLVLAGRAEAWGNFGHEAIALIAWDELAPAKENELNKIFAGAPSIYGGKTGIDALMFAATWPDVLREGHEHGGTLDVPLHIFDTLTPAGKMDSSTLKAVDNLHFADYDQTTNALAEPSDNVATGVTLALKYLKDASSTPLQKGEALSYLIHCVGDAHQPLHSGFSSDVGGNDITIHSLGGEKNLHAAWDTGFFATTSLFVKGDTPPTAFVSQIIDPIIPSVRTEALATLNPSDWVTESHDFAVQYAYVDEKSRKIVSGAKLSPTYLASRLPIAEERIAEAGVRLGALLNEALP